MPSFLPGDRVSGGPWFGSVAGEPGTVVEEIHLEPYGVDLIVVFDRPVTIFNHTRRRFRHSAHNFAHADETPSSDDEPFDSESENQFEEIWGCWRSSETRELTTARRCADISLCFGAHPHQITRIQKHGEHQSSAWNRSAARRTVYSSHSAAHRKVYSEGMRVPRSSDINHNQGW